MLRSRTRFKTTHGISAPPVRPTRVAIRRTVMLYVFIMSCFAFSTLNVHTWISYFSVDHGGHLTRELFDCAVSRVFATLILLLPTITLNYLLTIHHSYFMYFSLFNFCRHNQNVNFRTWTRATRLPYHHHRRRQLSRKWYCQMFINIRRYPAVCSLS